MRPLLHCVCLRTHLLWLWLRITLVLILAFAASASAQTPNESDPPASLPSAADAPVYCARVTRGVSHFEVLERFCLWTLSLNDRLPNIVSEQKTSRFIEIRDKRYISQDTIAASVSYEKGIVRYSNLRLNGKPSESKIEDIGGTWSTGEYGTDVQALFVIEQESAFSFLKIDNDKYKGSFIFQETIKPEANHTWELRFGSNKDLKTLYPGYTTRIWLDPSTSRLVHMEKETFDVEKRFPIRWVTKITTYANTPLGDGTSFVLPKENITINCTAEHKRQCTLNDLTFSNWRKFGAAHRILSDPPPHP
jgi:hypothetical protein